MTQRSRASGSRPRWPSVDKQLADAQAPSGSQLEQLIRDNQDFRLLHPAEASDDLGFPPWLRVYWRKSHPELDLSGPQPGYPLLLARIHEWLVRHPNSLGDVPAGGPGDTAAGHGGGSRG
jgi:hypothetical protein